jgi:hypothetical protein
MSGSDLGIQPWEVEKRLTKAFNRTARWKAMLLFDEADAFMAARGENLERNSMVSSTYAFTDT